MFRSDYVRVCEKKSVGESYEGASVRFVNMMGKKNVCVCVLAGLFRVSVCTVGTVVLGE